MTTWARLFGVVALCMALSAAARAADWVGDGYFWIDRNSVTRSGDFIFVNQADCDEDVAERLTAPERGVCTFYQARVNCVTHEVRSMSTGQSQILQVWSGLLPSLCAAAARSASPPTAAATQPAQTKPAAAKSTKADQKVCEAYGDDLKARIAACTRIIDSPNPGLADLVSAHSNRCRARIQAKESVDDALADCTRAMTLDPKSYDAVCARGAANNTAGRLDAAIADFTAAIALNPKATRAYFDRAQVYVAKKDVKNAVADFTAQRNVNPKADEGDFRLELCWVRGHLNAELETALSDCESAIRLKPKRSYGYQKRGLVRLRLGDLKGAREDADKTLSLEPKNAWALYARAIINAREGKTMASYDDYAAAKKYSPDYVVKDYDDMGLKIVVQPETAPFCPALTALIKAANERAASKAKADVAMPGATYCLAIDRGYWCAWETGVALAPTKQKAMATAAAACLTGYARKDSANTGATGPSTDFTQGKTNITIGTMLDTKANSIRAAGIAVTIAK